MKWNLYIMKTLKDNFRLKFVNLGKKESFFENATDNFFYKVFPKAGNTQVIWIVELRDF